MTAQFVLQPKPAELQNLADEYWEQSGNRERELERQAFEAGAAIRSGEYTLANLEAIVRWKSERHVSYLIANGSAMIRRALEVAAHPESSTYQAMCALMELRGVDVRMASAILEAIFPDRYIELDVDDLVALGQARQDIQFYEQYLTFCRGLAEKGVVAPQPNLPGPAPLHALDRALMQWARNRGE